MSEPISQPKHNIKFAVISALISAIFLSAMGATVKFIGTNVNTEFVVFIRFFFSFIIMCGYISYFLVTRKPIQLKTNNLGLQITRGIAGMLAVGLMFYVIKFIPLVNATLLFATYPLFVPLFLFIFFKKPCSHKVSMSIILGFIGVILILQPHANIFQDPASLIGLISGVCGAIAVIAIRYLNKRNEPTHLILFYYYIIGTLILGIASIFYWQEPSLHMWLLLILVALTGTFYQGGLIIALRYAPAKLVSVLMYFSIIINGLLGWWIWNEVPNTLSFIGIILVIIGAILVIIFQARDTAKQELALK